MFIRSFVVLTACHLLAASLWLEQPCLAAADAKDSGSDSAKDAKKAKKSGKDKGADDKKGDDKKPEEKASETKSESKPADTSASAPGEKDVLDSSRFFGAAAIGYAAAKKIPNVANKLFCYCGCDITDKHNNLLDCFTSVHGVDCHICQEEVVLALKLSRDDVPIAEIQRQIDEKYSGEYPFEEPSPTYKKYKTIRLYNAAGSIDAKAAETKSGGKISDVPAGPDAPADDKNKKWEPKLKPGKQPAACCSAADHEKEKDSAKKKEK